MPLADTITGTRWVLKLYRDDDPSNPRDDDNVGTMVCWHRNYDLGDEQPRADFADWRRELACELDPTLERRIDYWENGNGWVHLYRTRSDEEACKQSHERVDALVDAVLARETIMLPLYLFDHSGISMRTSSRAFRACDPAGWDWGAVGVIYCTRQRALAEWGKAGGKLTRAVREKAERSMRGEVSIYNDYLTGNVYGFVLKRQVDPANEDEPDALEEVDSCWGFYGDDPLSNGMADHLPEEVLTDLYGPDWRAKYDKTTLRKEV